MLALAALVIGGASAVVQGPLPGDVALTRGLQALLGAGPGWAAWLTETAKAPLLWGTLALAGALAWWGAAWRGAVAVPLAYAGAFACDKALRAVLFVPRPDPDMVAVAAQSGSSGLPSTFGLVYAGIFGVTLLARGDTPARLIAGALLIGGIAARVVLGGHWPSQMLASAALGLFLAWAALDVIRRVFRR
jgi:membrane-associated phospholipid phosphatase